MFNQAVYSKNSQQYQYYLENDLVDDDVEILSNVFEKEEIQEKKKIDIPIKLIASIIKILFLIYGIYLVFNLDLFILLLILYARDVILFYMNVESYSDQDDVDRVYNQFKKEAQNALYPLALDEKYSQQMLKIIQGLIHLNLWQLMRLDHKTLESIDQILIQVDQTVLLRQLSIIFNKKQLYLNTQQDQSLIKVIRRQDYQAFHTSILDIQRCLAILSLECQKENQSLLDGMQNRIQKQVLKYFKSLQEIDQSEEKLKDFQINFLALSAFHQNCLEMMQNKKQEDIKQISCEFVNKQEEQIMGIDEQQVEKSNKFIIYNEESDDDDNIIIPRRPVKNMLLQELHEQVKQKEKEFDYEYKNRPKRREKQEEKMEKIEKIGSFALFQELRLNQKK